MQGVPRQVHELRQPDLGQEAPDPVDDSLRELVPGGLEVAEVNQAIAAAPAIGVDDGAGVHPTASNAALTSSGRRRSWTWP